MSSHKIGGFSGVGALFLKKGVSVPSLIRGGSQEKGVRAGTENLPGIISLGLCAKSMLNQQWLGQGTQLGESLKKALLKINGLEIHGKICLETVVNFHIKGVNLDNGH